MGSLAQRRVLAQVQNVLRRIARRAPRRVQRLALSTLKALTRRWPLLSRLAGMAPGSEWLAVASPIEPCTPEPTRADSLASLRLSNDPSARTQAARALSQVLDPETTAALIAALRDETAEVAMEAADALRRHPAELAVPALRNALENREGYFSAATRAAAVRALGVLLPVGEGATIAGAVRDGDLSVSLAGIAALAERAEAGSAEALLKLLEDRSGFYLPLTRHAAARGLSQLAFGDADRVRALLNTEADSTVRDALVGWPAV